MSPPGASADTQISLMAMAKSQHRAQQLMDAAMDRIQD